MCFVQQCHECREKSVASCGNDFRCKWPQLVYGLCASCFEKTTKQWRAQYIAHYGAVTQADPKEMKRINEEVAEIEKDIQKQWVVSAVSFIDRWKKLTEDFMTSSSKSFIKNMLAEFVPKKTDRHADETQQ